MAPMDTTVVVLVVIALILSPLVAGEIRHTEIKDDERAAIPLNVFFFTKGGELELNITRPSLLPVPNDPASLSEIGFVLLQPDTWNDLSLQITEGNTTCALEYPNAYKVVTFDQLTTPAKAEWNLLLPSPAKYSQYTLLFVNCLSHHQKVKVSLSVSSAMYNRVENGGRGKPTTMSYLMDGPIVPVVYFWFALVYLFLAVLWIIIMLANGAHVSRVHYCVLLALLLKALNLSCVVVKKRYIDRTGSSAWSLEFWFYVSSFFNSLSLHTLILVIGCTQCQLPKKKKPPLLPLETRDDKCMFMLALIVLHLAVNAALSLSDGEACLLYSTGVVWVYVARFFNGVAMFSMLLSFSSSLKKLQRAGAHGHKMSAVLVLKKYKLLRRYLRVVFSYSFIGPSLEYAFRNYIPTNENFWILIALPELVALALYAYTTYMFPPKEELDDEDDDAHRPLVVNDDEEEAAARELDNLMENFVTLYNFVP